MKLSDRAYKLIKYIITIFLPAVGALYFALSQVWDFQRITGVNGTINALITFGGLLIGYSTRQYNKAGGGTDGDLITQSDTEDGTTYLGLAVNGASVSDVLSKDRVTLNVVNKPMATAEDDMAEPEIPHVIPGTSSTVNPATSHEG